MQNEILEYIKNGFTLEGNPQDGYTVWTLPTQSFTIQSLDDLTPQKFEEAKIRFPQKSEEKITPPKLDDWN